MDLPLTLTAEEVEQYPIATNWHKCPIGQYAYWYSRPISTLSKKPIVWQLVLILGQRKQRTGVREMWDFIFFANMLYEHCEVVNRIRLVPLRLSNEEMLTHPNKRLQKAGRRAYKQSLVS